MDLIRIGQYIAGKRKALGLTQKQLAEKLGVDVLWIFPDGGIRYTSGLEARIVK